MNLHDIATEFCGCWEHGPAGGLFVRIASAGGEFAVREAPGGRYRVDWLPSNGGCETVVLGYEATRRRVGAIPGYEHAVLRLPTPRQVLEALLPQFGLSLFGDCLMTSDRWLVCDLTDVPATLTMLREQFWDDRRLSAAELVARLREANPGG